MLAVMESYGTITPDMRRAALAFRAVILGAEPAVLRQLGALGGAGGSCVVAVLGLGRSLKDWARQGWRGRPIAQETAAGIFVAALAQLASQWQPTTTTKPRTGAPCDSPHCGATISDAPSFGAAGGRRMSTTS